MPVSSPDIERCVLALPGSRAPTASICPSDVARSLAGDESGWRALMPVVRDAAVRLARDGPSSITQVCQSDAPSSNATEDADRRRRVLPG
ncbi:DUF3253 domain-containing protein [Paraburkholderia terrae]|uniref:DUF3253 domain-containing protein n=1 Tax=Paraburkholderia terrae TaxID=311230 RepID=UPI0033658310